MTRRVPTPSHFAIVSVALTAVACLPVKTYRLNPEVEPAEYRIVCGNKSAVCRSQAEKVCDSEYDVLSEDSNFPEPDTNSPGASQAPTTRGEWKGEMQVRCSGGPPPLSLKRKPVPAPSSSEDVVTAPIGSAGTAPAVAPIPAASTAPRVCVPGVTQPCLGPGACSGAQSCTPDGAGFSSCDCGATTPAPPAPTQPVPSPSVPPAPAASSEAEAK